ncbi:MAG TPA: ATP-binding protein [Steroidobacteraceae bacterium]|nr:ATP-binding protein [Steroidobacteraceae bacterium]
MSSTPGRVSAARQSMDVEPADLDFLTGGGEMGELMHRLDWSSTSLGSASHWPQSLRTAVGIMLSSRYPMFVWWGRELISLYNDAYRPFLGSKHPHALGQPAAEVWAEIWDQIGPRTRAVLERAESTFDESLLLLMERFGYPEETYFTFAYSPIRGEDGTVAGLFCAVTEDTRRVIGERRLRLLREVASTASETHSPEQVCSAVADCMSGSARDLPFALLYLTEQGGEVARLVARANMEPGRGGAETVINLDGSDTIWPLRRALLDGDAVVVEGLRDRLETLPTGAWDRPPERAVVMPLREQAKATVAGFLIVGLNPYLPLDEHYRGFLGLLADQIAAGISRARAYQEERKRAEALAEIDRAKTAFFSNVSHEFRTPLTLMLGPIDEAAAHAATPEAVKAHLDLARRNALRLLKLVNSLLDFARIEAGRVQASYEPTDLAALTRDLASAFRSAMERAGLILRVECDDLGEPAYVDREMWEKIVLNLLSNAFKFTLQGEVTVRLRRQGESAVLEVTDTGVGVPAHELPRLFERFHRVEGTAGRTQEGSGIGLALVQELIKLHGGRIEVSSELGSGSTFRVLMPLGTQHLPPERIKASRSLASTALGPQVFVQEALRWASERDEPDARTALAESPGPPLDPRFLRTAGARVLIADDNADMRAYVRDLLSPAYRIETAVDGEQALAAARRLRPDLILCDIMMPRLDGLGLLKAVRDDEALRDVPLILLSARAGEEARLEGFDTGADDYLVKPFAARELLARVGALLELTQMRRESEERFRAFVSATSEVIYRMSPDWSELRHLQGRDFIPDTDHPSRTWLAEYVHPDDQAEVMAAVREAIRTRSMFELEHRVRRVDGSWGWVLSRAIPLKDRDGNITEWFGAASDVTERRLAEHARGWLAALIESSNDAIVSKTLDGIVTSWNPAAVHLFGYEPEEIIGKPITTIIPPELHHEETEFLARLRRGECIENHETVRIAKDGRRLEVALTISPIQDESGAIIGASKIARDIAAQKRAERALREADRRKNEFLALLGHELRNPLSPIRTASELLSRTLEGESPARTSVDMIQRQAAHLTRLVDDLLDIGRITQGRIHLKRCSLELGSVIAQAIETVEPLLRQKQHQVSIVSSYQPLYVNGDFARLVQCVVNLLTNAAKYTDQEGQIRIVTRAESSWAVIEISDTGVGIAPELLPEIFDLFVQSDRTLDRAQGGLGIGLSVVKRLIEMHGGEVSAQSAGLGHGSSFVIRLPRGARPEAAARVESVKSPPRRVLIVDDNVDAANALAMLLSYTGHEAQVAYSGREALARIESFQPDVALLDIGLPEMDGYELASRLRAHPRFAATRLLALTGYGQSEDRARSREAGFEDHLVKPVDLAALERALAGKAASDLRLH